MFTDTRPLNQYLANIKSLAETNEGRVVFVRKRINFKIIAAINPYDTNRKADVTARC